MPLIDVMTNPKFVCSRADGLQGAVATTRFIREQFGLELPAVFAQNSSAFGMGPTLEAGVQVRFHEYGPEDINTADLWVLVQLSEEPPCAFVRRSIRNAIYTVLLDTLRRLDIQVPSFVLDVFWGPSSGRGIVSGVPIEW